MRRASLGSMNGISSSSMSMSMSGRASGSTSGSLVDLTATEIRRQSYRAAGTGQTHKPSAHGQGASHSLHLAQGSTSISGRNRITSSAIDSEAVSLPGATLSSIDLNPASHSEPQRMPRSTIARAQHTQAISSR